MPKVLYDDLGNLILLVGNVLDAYSAALFLLDEEDHNTLRLEVCHSLSNNIVAGASISTGQGLIGWVARNERATHATNFDRSTTTLQFYSKDEKIKSFAAAPLFIGGRLVGVLSVDSKSKYMFTEKSLKILNDFANSASGIIAQGERRIRLGQEAVAFEALSDLVEKITVCEKFSELIQNLKLNLPRLIPHEKMVLAIRSHEEECFHIVGASPDGKEEIGTGEIIGQYRIGWVLAQGRAIEAADINGAPPVVPGEEKWRSFIGAPMVADEMVDGAICLLSKKPRAFRQVDTMSLQILAAALSSVFTSLTLRLNKEKENNVDCVAQTISRQALLEANESMEGEGAVAILNLHGFGMVNQRLGWRGGDHVLHETANRMIDIVGDTGEVCRDYADRFILLMRDMDKDNITRITDMVIEAVETNPYIYGGYEIHITCSMGVAFFPLDGDKIERLTEKAWIAASRARGLTSGLRVSIYEDASSKGPHYLKSMNKS